MAHPVPIILKISNLGNRMFQIASLLSCGPLNALPANELLKFSERHDVVEFCPIVGTREFVSSITLMSNPRFARPFPEGTFLLLRKNSSKVLLPFAKK